MDLLRVVVEDLGAEQRALDELVCRLSAADWEVRTPSEPWVVRDQIAHLAFFDDAAPLTSTF